jgi:hypothetical protein
MASKANEQITVNLTYSWTFNEKEWDVGKEHMELMKNDPRIVRTLTILPRLPIRLANI